MHVRCTRKRGFQKSVVGFSFFCNNVLHSIAIKSINSDF